VTGAPIEIGSKIEIHKLTKGDLQRSPLCYNSGT
jgi:hypothetical protein